MKIIDLQTKNMVMLTLPTIYFGLPVFRSNGDYYSTSFAATLAAQAVDFAEDKVMAKYHASGIIDIVGLSTYYREQINEFMMRYGGSAGRSSGNNINVTSLGTASYGFPIIGCL